jgi:competence protein ComEC
MRYAATIAGLFIFVAITGAPASVFRASIMAAILLISQMSNRSYNNFNTLALAAFILLIINPNELLNPGFQLSFSAVFSILYFYPIFSNYINKIEKMPSVLRKLLLFFAVSFSAQLGTLPFTLTYFHKLSVIALLANLLVIPLIGIIVSTAISSLSLSLISIWIGEAIAVTNEAAISLLYAIVKFSGNLEFTE